MHSLAPLPLAKSIPLDWERAAIPGRALKAHAIRHLKATLDRAAHLEATLGLAEAGRISMIGAIECLSMGPGEWLLLAPAEHGEQLAALERRAGDNGAANAAAESRLVAIELDLSVDQLASLTGLPDNSLRPGRVARTRLADVPVTIAAGLSARCRLLFDRTHAPHVRAWLDRAI